MITIVIKNLKTPSSRGQSFLLNTSSSEFSIEGLKRLSSSKLSSGNLPLILGKNWPETSFYPLWENKS